MGHSWQEQCFSLEEQSDCSGGVVLGNVWQHIVTAIKFLN